ncbi:hypothetical protein [Mycolicibacterium thermoresistibile]
MTGSHLPARLRLRRRLLLYSAPVAALVLLIAIKLISVVIAGNSAATNFADGDADGLRRNVATLQIANVIEPTKASFAAGALAVLDGRLEEADARFTEVLARTAPTESCPVRVNLELVRERQGDHAAWAGRPDDARERYTSALGIIDDAPPGCFADNTDPDPDRRAVRADAAARLAAKLAGLGAAPPPAAPLPPLAPPPPPPPVGAAPAPEADESPEPLRLNPDSGDPLDRLRQVLEDAAG